MKTALPLRAAWLAAFLTACAPVGATAGLTLEVETGNALHLIHDVSAPLTVSLANTDGGGVPRGTVRIADIRGHGMQFAAGGTSDAVRMPVPGPLPGKGYYRVSFVTNGVAAAETSFAVIDRHGVTPFRAKPAFRMGFTSHLDWYGDGERATMLAALVACGAKIVRCGFWSMRAVCPNAERCNWTKADRAVRELRAHGLAINATVHPFAAWAAETNRAEICRRDKADWAIGCLPPRPGVYRAYCRRLAERYGTQIDYYEVGNEFDLIPAWILPKAEAVRLQREAYEGIRAGCAEACVTTCGWAVGDSADLTPLGGRRLPNDGLIEYFAEHAKPWFDVQAVHQHGPFAEYPRRLKEHFFALRTRLGVTQPWFANETAVHGAGGREVQVARDVWRKILYARAQGSVDYTWYNLRAKPGAKWAGVENAYGVMTSDFHPRPSYAAFAALATLLGDAEVVRLQEDERHVFVCLADAERMIRIGWTRPAGGRDEMRVPTGEGTVEVCDLMGNRSPARIADGVCRWLLSEEPSALIVEAVAKPREGRAPSRPRPRQSAALPSGNGGFATASVGKRKTRR